jgi:N-sulfoglucosamine sulfohydrolase
MRSRHEIPHDRIPYYPDQLRAAGYYTANWKKTDFNIGGREDSDCWDHHGEVEWEKLSSQQPFFQIINLGRSHESKAHGEVENTDHDPADTRLRAYHPDLPDVRKNYAKYHDAVKRMDSEVGTVLARLEELGLAENTIVIHNSDHGGVLPRSKRYIFSSGLHCPLIVRIPEKYQALWPAEQPGTQIDRLVSFVDMPKTWLSLADAEVPGTMQGRSFSGRRWSLSRITILPSADGWMNGWIMPGPSPTSAYLYIRNYMPYVPWMQHLLYLWRSKAAQAWDAHVRSGKAVEVEARFFRPRAGAKSSTTCRKIRIM